MINEKLSLEEGKRRLPLICCFPVSCCWLFRAHQQRDLYTHTHTLRLLLNFQSRSFRQECHFAEVEVVIKIYCALALGLCQLKLPDLAILGRYTSLFSMRILQFRVLQEDLCFEICYLLSIQKQKKKPSHLKFKAHTGNVLAVIGNTYIYLCNNINIQ